MSARFEDRKRRVAADTSGIARDRAEILDLIRKLADRHIAERIARAPKPPTAPSRPAEEPNRLAPETAAARTLPRSWPPEEPSHPSRGSGMVFMQNLDRRLRHLEEALLKRTHTTAAPAPEASAMFSGIIQGQMLSDMLQLVSSNNMTGEFVVQSDASKCSLYFDDGRICHAQSPGAVGEEAFFAAFGFETGRYYFLETAELPETRTIDSSTQFLILEALRQIDEDKST